MQREDKQNTIKWAVVLVVNETIVSPQQLSYAVMHERLSTKVTTPNFFMCC